MTKYLKSSGLLGLTCLFALAACQDNRATIPGGIPQEGFGDAVKANIAAQTVNPAAPIADGKPMTSDGARASVAQDRYARDRVKVPPDPATSSITTGVGQSSASTGTSSGK